MTVDDDDRAAVIALSGLPGIGPSRLRALLGNRSSSAAWADVCGGRVEVDEALAAACRQPPGPAALLERWTTAARGVDPHELRHRHRAAGVHILCPGDEGWPSSLVDDPDPPSVLFVLGDPATLGHSPAVAVVGTRQATRYGLEVARGLGRGLARAGVAVVSGLAAGIDGAGHHAAIEAAGAPPIGVVGCGLDVVYPRGHRQLWERVAAIGALASEWPLGTKPAQWRFPARNRIIAALADAVVIVESPPTGGSMHTVEEAVRRDRPVLAVPGPVTSRASRGTNRLLADGAVPACDLDDVLVAVGLGGIEHGTPAVSPPNGDAGRVLDALGWRPATLDQVVLRTGMGLAGVARHIAALEAGGWLASDGGWLERRR